MDLLRLLLANISNKRFILEHKFPQKWNKYFIL